MRKFKMIGLFAVVIAFSAACRSAPLPSSVEGTYSSTLPAASTPGRSVKLTLNKDQTAKMESDHMNGQPIIVEVGSWEFAPDKSIIVNLMMEYEGAIKEVIVFTKKGDTLNSTQHDQNIYGTEGLKLKKIK